MGWNPTVRQVLRTDLSARSSRKLYSCSTTLTFCRIIASLLQNCERRVTSNTVVLHHIHPSIVPWVHHPLVSNAHLTIIFHASLSCAFHFSMHISSLHHSFTSSSHSIFGRPLFVFPFISPNTTSFTSLLSSILQ